MLLNVRNPLLPRLVSMMRQIRRPRSLNNILGTRSIHNNLITESTSLTENQHIQRISKIIAINDGVFHWIRRFQRNRTAGLGREQLRDHREGVLMVDWELVVLLWSAVAFCGEEFYVGLLGGQAHGISPR